MAAFALSSFSWTRFSLRINVRSAGNIGVERMKNHIQDIFDQSMAIESFTHTGSEREIEAFLQERIGEINEEIGRASCRERV